MSIADKILRLNEIKADIKQSIIDKGQVVDDDMSTYADAISNISGEVNNQDITVIKNGVYTAEEGYTGLGKVIVDVPQGIDPEGTFNIVKNGRYDIREYNEVDVNVETPSEEITVFNGTADNHEAGDFVFVRKGEGKSVLSGDISYQGSDVIIDNNFIARNFTVNSYLVVDNSVIRKNCEYNFKFTTDNDINSFQNVASIFPLFELYVENGRMLAWNESGENSPLYAGDVQPNTTYYAKIIYSTNEEDEDTLQLAYSTDGSDWQYSSTELTWCDNCEYFRLGWSVHGLSSRYWRGSIDLNEVYVSENSVKVWEAVSGSSVLNVDVVGLVSINNNIASGFSESSYITETLDLDISKPFEIYIRALTVDDGDHNVIMSNFTSGASPFRFDYLKVRSWSSSGEGGSYEVELNKFYDIKGVSNGETWSLYAKRVDESEWHLSYECPVTYMFSNGSNQLVFGRNTNQWSTQFLYGSIDLNKCYIKIDGVKAWEAVSKSTGINIKTIGSISIDNGIASGFSNDDYLKLPYIIPSSFSTMEIVVKFKALEIEGDDYPIINQLHAVRDIFVEGRSKKVCQWNGSECIRGQTIISEDMYYTLKITSNGVTNNIFVNDNLEFSTTSDIFKNVELCFGGTAAGQQYFPGFIDLNDCYIKINGVKVWKAIARSEDEIVNKNEADDDTLYCKVLERIDSGNKGLVAICNVKHKNLNINTNGTYSLDNALLRSVEVNVRGSSEDDGAYEAYTVLYNVVNSTDRNADHEVNEVISVLERI